MQANYKKQVSLLLQILPEVAEEKCFALHGGTAINLFVRNMPRLSVDIDLTYLPIQDRKKSVAEISAALQRIKSHIEGVIPNVHILHRAENAKLLVSSKGAEVKLEVNLTNRGGLAEPREMELCQRAQDEFEAFCVMPVVSQGQLYGGKIVAALDRQHPRDLFDVRDLLAEEGITQEIKEGFIHYLICSNRAIGDVISPNLQDQRGTMNNQFSGMTNVIFEYSDFEQVREQLIRALHDSLTTRDKEFILSVKNVTPDWSIYDFEKYPGIKWKLNNLEKLKKENPQKHKAAYEALLQKINHQ
ncbi:nucleotidyl transferase AbiEii/AbiGii toxin family protein [Chitinophaga sp. sic0106]|uniref:nucleotidyl transferase AbiEii/AbiGii toxin family protein n=1 Tax=Chitinophaga sp. sic0106 TaxID=2854785 RepID=UPI001C464A26|nr:nucleotidyl transferase AbiEii/AbiGii toxin family protein [Chitinophaga sp. sic0106]MBV7533798.1 nucleotidyl transferase AbiEii/AbiGii toxin family protein [Chitinophaga sp. sic0106]